MADISKITLPSGNTYDIKDAIARNLIQSLAGFTKFLGVTTTILTDGSTINPVTINGEAVTADTGSIVTYGSQEFIFNGTAWQAFGDLSALGALAYKDEAEGSYTPAGTVSQPIFTGNSNNINVAVTVNTNGNYTPAGTVSQPTFSGNELTSTGKFTPEGEISFSNTNKTATVSTTTGTATYTPGGSVSAPTISVATAGATTTVKNPTSQTVAKTVASAAPGATAPANPVTYATVTNETLSLYQLGYTTGDSITTSDVTVKTGDAAYSASTPSFTGIGVRLVTDNISVPNTATFSGTEGNLSVKGTPAGSVTQPTFTGTAVQIEGTVTPTGTVSQPTFTGTATIITVS